MACVFFFNDTATTEIYTLSLHDALPICRCVARCWGRIVGGGGGRAAGRPHAGRPPAAAVPGPQDRKSTRLNSSHANISYAVFCLKKKSPSGASLGLARLLPLPPFPSELP